MITHHFIIIVRDSYPTFPYIHTLTHFIARTGKRDFWYEHVMRTVMTKATHMFVFIIHCYMFSSCVVLFVEF